MPRQHAETLKVGLLQMQAVPLKVEENLTRAGELIARCAKDGAQLVVLPEMFNVGFYFGEALMAVAESLTDGRTTTWLQARAAEHNVFIVTSVYERYVDHFYNTMVLVGPDGDLQYYRKRNPNQYATQLGVPTVFVNQGGTTHTPLPAPKYYPWSLKKIAWDFCGRSNVRSAKGEMLVQARPTEVEFCQVVSIELSSRSVYEAVSRVDMRPQYLKPRYYFVQPPFLVKVIQAWSFYGFQDLYEARRARFLRSRDG